MATDWCGFLVLAEILAAGTTEAEYRSAISRAYYSAFHVCEEAAIAKGADFDPYDRKSRHDRLWRWFKSRSSSISWRVSKEGFALRDKRNNADYDDAVSGLQKEAEFAISRAKTLIKLSADAKI